MEVGEVRKRVLAAITAARTRAQARRQQTAAAEQSYAAFLEHVATPLFRNVQMALKAEGFAFTVATPGDSVRLASDKGREDFVEVRLDTSFDPPQVIGRVSQTRGSRRLDEERPIKPGSGPEAIDADDLLGFVVTALEPWLAR